MLNISIDGTDVSLELLESQKYKNMEVISELIKGE